MNKSPLGRLSHINLLAYKHGFSTHSFTAWLSLALAPQAEVIRCSTLYSSLTGYLEAAYNEATFK